VRSVARLLVGKRIISNTEKSDSLWLKSNIVARSITWIVWLNRLISESRCFSLPLNLLALHSSHVLTIGDCPLDNSDAVEDSLAIIDLVPQAKGIIVDIEVLKLVQNATVEKIGNVLDSQKDLILGLREQVNLDSSVACRIAHRGLRLHSVVLG